MYANYPKVSVVVGVFAAWAFIGVIIKIFYGQRHSRWISHHGPGLSSPDLIFLAMLCGFMKDTIYVHPMSNSTGMLMIQITFSTLQKENDAEEHSKRLLDVQFHLVHATYYCPQ
jgi:hypothetical protein